MTSDQLATRGHSHTRSGPLTLSQNEHQRQGINEQKHKANKQTNRNKQTTRCERGKVEGKGIFFEENTDNTGTLSDRTTHASTQATNKGHRTVSSVTH